MSARRPLAVGLTPLETRRDVILHVATRAEELGYDAVYVAEGWGHDVSVLLAEVALRTTRIRIGTGVLNVWGRSAGTIAMLAGSLADLSGGRFDLGLGAGSPQLAEGLHDVEFRAPAERLRTVTGQVRGLLGGGRLEPSRPAAARTLKLASRSPYEVPVLLAALAPASIRACGELADGWYPFLLPAPGLADGIRLLADGAAGAGRPVPRVCPGVPVSISDDPARAGAGAAWWVEFYLTSMGPLYARTLRAHGLGAAVDEVLASSAVPDGLLDALTLWGDAGAALAGLDRWYAAGADMPVLVLPPGRSPAELDAVLYALRPETVAATVA